MSAFAQLCYDELSFLPVLSADFDFQQLVVSECKVKLLNDSIGYTLFAKSDDRLKRMATGFEFAN